MTPFYLTVSCFVTAKVSAYLGTSILQYHLPTQEYSPLFHYSDLVFSPFIKFYISSYQACSSLVKRVFCLPLLTTLNFLPSLSLYSKDEKKAIRFCYFFNLVIQIHLISKVLEVLPQVSKYKITSENKNNFFTFLTSLFNFSLYKLPS